MRDAGRLACLFVLEGEGDEQSLKLDGVGAPQLYTGTTLWPLKSWITVCGSVGTQQGRHMVLCAELVL